MSDQMAKMPHQTLENFGQLEGTEAGATEELFVTMTVVEARESLKRIAAQKKSVDKMSYNQAVTRLAEIKRVKELHTFRVDQLNSLLIEITIGALTPVEKAACRVMFDLLHKEVIDDAKLVTGLKAEKADIAKRFGIFKPGQASVPNLAGNKHRFQHSTSTPMSVAHSSDPSAGVSQKPVSELTI